MRARTMVSRVAVLGVLAALVWVPTAARAGQTGGGTDASGYTVNVHIHFSGSGLEGGAAVEGDVPVHPSCWWAPAPGDNTDMKAMQDWYLGILGPGGAQTAGDIARYGPPQAWQDAVDEAKAGAKLTWYVATCNDPADYNKFGIGAAQGTDPVNGNGQNWQTFLYHAFVDGEQPPAPLLSTAELAKAAYARLHIEEPVLDWNPKLKGNDSTLVGLATWFWVTNPPAVGGNGGALDVKAALDGTDLSATVTATTNGLTLSDGRSAPKTCGPQDAQVAYVVGDSATTSPCTFTFAHSGAPVAVTAATQWGATWIGSDGQGGGLAGLNQASNTNVNVAEVQNIVTR